MAPQTDRVVVDARMGAPLSVAVQVDELLPLLRPGVGKSVPAVLVEPDVHGRIQLVQPKLPDWS